MITKKREKVVKELGAGLARLTEMVVATAMRQCLTAILLNCSETNILAKFIVERQDAERYELFRLSS